MPRYVYTEANDTVSMSASTFAALLANQMPTPPVDRFCAGQTTNPLNGLTHLCTRPNNHTGTHYNMSRGSWVR